MNARRWIRPRWYVTHAGDIAFGGPFRDSVRVSHEPDEAPTCSVCGVACPTGGYDLDAGYMCVEHGSAWHDAHPVTGWHKLAQSAGIRIDNLYFTYAKRFGKRVHLHD